MKKLTSNEIESLVKKQKRISEEHESRKTYEEIEWITDLHNRDFRNFDFTGVNLWRVEFRNCDLRGANLGDSDLGETFFGENKIDDTTIFNDSIKSYVGRDEVLDALLEKRGIK